MLEDPEMRCFLSLPFLILLTLPLVADPTATVELSDTTIVRGTIDLPALVIKTDYGFLTVPVSDVLATWPDFDAGKSTTDRVEILVERLKTPGTQAAADTELRRIGRPAVPFLQKAAADPDEQLSRQASLILKDLWPSLAKVDPQGHAVLVSRNFTIRGHMSFRTLRVVTDKGPLVLSHDQIRLISFTAGDPPDLPDWPYRPDAPSLRPDLEAQLIDGSKIRGQLDRASLTVTTLYGTLIVPLRSLVSIRPDTKAKLDEVTTRDFLLRGTVELDAFNLTTKIGPLALARDKFDLLSVVGIPEEVAQAPAPAAQPPPKPADDQAWQKLFNGKDLKGWRKWGPGSVSIAENSVVMDGECGLTYEGMPPIGDLIISAEVKLIKPGITKLALRESAKGLYHVEFTGSDGTIAHWDNEQKKNVVLTRFKFDPTPDQVYRMEFGALGHTLLAYVNGNKVAEVQLPDDDVLGPGSVNISIYNATSAFRAIEMKPLK